MSARTQVNSATGLMGKTGGGKSYQLALLARSVWERFHKVTLYYNSDGGGFPAAIQELQALGIMRVFRMRTRDPGDGGLAFETAYRCYQGWWPKRINPSSGEVPPGVEMVPPIALQFQMYCPHGHLVKTVPSESLLMATVCATCKKPVTKQDMRVTKAIVQNVGFEDVGAVMYDGLSSVLSWELMEMGHRAGRMELRGEEGAIGGKVTSGDLKFGGITRSHVGFAQTRGEELVHLTLGIPNLVIPPVITMLTHEDVDERGLNITGPKIAGRAKTDEAPQWYGNMLECDRIPALQGNGEQRVLYLKEFTDPSGRRHLCKIRGNPGTMPGMLLDDPGGDDDAAKAGKGCNLGLFFQMLDAALSQSIEQARVEIPDAPGLPDGWVEIGGLGGLAVPQAAIPSTSLPLAAPAVPSGPPVLSAASVPAAPTPATVFPAPATTTVVASAAPAAPPTAAKPRKPRGQATALAQPPAPPTATPIQAAAPAPPLVAGPAQPSLPLPVAPPAAAAAPAVPSQRTVAPPPGARPPLAAATGTPAGATVNGPGASRPLTPTHPTAAVPRPPAAAPRPPTPAPRPTGPGARVTDADIPN